VAKFNLEDDFLNADRELKMRMSAVNFERDWEAEVIKQARLLERVSDEVKNFEKVRGDLGCEFTKKKSNEDPGDAEGTESDDPTAEYKKRE